MDPYDMMRQPCSPGARASLMELNISLVWLPIFAHQVPRESVRLQGGAQHHYGCVMTLFVDNMAKVLFMFTIKIKIVYRSAQALCNSIS